MDGDAKENGKENGELPLLTKENGCSFDESDFKTVHQFLPNSNYCMITVLLSVSSVMMSTGISVGALNPSLAILNGFYNQTYMDRYGEPVGDDAEMLLALTVSMMFAGGFVGALSIGWVLSRLSRKGAMVAMNGTNVVSVMLITLGGRLIPSYEAIIVGRFIMGLFCGFGMNLIPIVVAETSSLPRQAFYLSLIGVNLSFGGLFGLCFSFKEVLGTEDLWPVLLTLSVLPSLFYLFLSPWLPQTPSYLLRQGNAEEALNTFKSLRKFEKEEDVLKEFAAMEKMLKSDGRKIRSVTISEMLSSPRYRTQLLAVIMVFLQSQLCGINAIGSYTNTIFLDAKFDQNGATTASSVVYAVQFFMALAGSGAVDRWGTRTINVASGSIMSASLVLLTLSRVFVEIPGWPYVGVVAVTIYVLIWACGISLTLFPMLTAFTTEQTRETAFTYGGGLFWIMSWFVSFISLYLMKFAGAYAFLPWCILNAFFAGYVMLCLPKTKGKTPDEIQKHFCGETKSATLIDQTKV